MQNIYPTEVDGQIVPSNINEGNFDSTYLHSTIEKQMSFMNQYGENLSSDLNRLADNMEKHKYMLADEGLDPKSVTERDVDTMLDNAMHGKYKDGT